jgi:effector-binding domain-containing protein/uncharacterized protein YndB with AHSA1/START domain
MRVIKELLLAAIVTVIFFAVLMALLPSRASVVRSLEIQHPLVQVNDMVTSFKQFPLWSPWGFRDPNVTYQFTPNLSGPGARASWYSARDKWIGDGSLQIEDVSPGEWVSYSLNAPWRGHTKTADLTMAETETGAVKVTFKVDVDYGWDLFGRVRGLYLEGQIGDDLMYSLGKIKEKIESLPDVDYSDDFAEAKPIEVELLPLNVIAINGQAATSEPYSIQPTVLSYTKTLTATIDIKKLNQTGPRLAVLNRWGQNYDFTAAIPVRETEADLPESVRFDVIEGGRHLKIHHHGPRWDLPRQRDMLVAWAGANGYKIRGPIVEEFLNDLGGEGEDAIREADLRTNIYLPVE